MEKLRVGVVGAGLAGMVDATSAELSVPNQIPNADLKPEETRSWEVGTELRFLSDRISLDGTYYDKLTDNQIIPVQISGSSGYTSAVLNAGAISNKGVELLVNATPVKTNTPFTPKAFITSKLAREAPVAGSTDCPPHPGRPQRPECRRTGSWSRAR